MTQMLSPKPSESRIRDSVSVQMSLVLIIVYIIFSLNLLDASFFVQINPLVWQGWVWMLFTSLFLHANLLHLGGNILFLLIFGTVLEEQVTRKRWLVTYFASGVMGNVAFLLLGPLLGQEIGLGASGAIYGLLGAAMGMKGTFLIIFLLGLDIFAGGGEIAHVAGLVMGLFIHRWGDALAKVFGPNLSNYSS